MIEDADRRLKDWAKTVLEDAEISLGPPRALDSASVVSLYLTDILPAPRTSTSRRLPLQTSLRYLVTAWADKPETEHRQLGDLVFAAMEHPEFEVELAAQPAEFWLAFGIAPRPAFMLRLPVQVERPEPQIGRIRHPVEVRFSPAVSLAGRLVGPADVPLSGAQVELASLQLTTRTDATGRFRFAAVPAQPDTKELRIRLKGNERRVKVTHGADSAQPLVIRFDTMEV